MDLHHSFSVPLDPASAWEAFNDLQRIAPCFPGAQITSVDGDDFTGMAKVRLGPVSLQYTGSGRFVERDEERRRAVIEAAGKDKRGNGTASATITAQLEPEGDGTRCVVDTDLRITGRPAQFGRGVISDVGDKLLSQFAACLADTLGEPRAPEAAAATAPPAREQEPPPVPAPGPPTPLVPPAARTGGDELDLRSLLVPALAQRYGATVLACVVTAVVTWWLARRSR